MPDQYIGTLRIERDAQRRPIHASVLVSGKPVATVTLEELLRATAETNFDPIAPACYLSKAGISR